MAGIPWARVQAVSGLLFAGFATVHLVNIALASRGAAAFDGLQRALRTVYQHPAIEIGLVLSPLLVHMVASVARMRQRRGAGTPRNLRTRLHRYAGYILLLFIVGHVAATRLPSLAASVYPEFSGLAFTFQFAPYWFYPYYPSLALAGLVHLWIGVPLALAIIGLRMPMAWRRGGRLWVPLGAAAGALLLGVSALGGLLWDIPDLSGHPFARLLRSLTELPWSG